MLVDAGIDPCPIVNDNIREIKSKFDAETVWMILGHFRYKSVRHIEKPLVLPDPRFLRRDFLHEIISKKTLSSKKKKSKQKPDIFDDIDVL